LVGLSVISCAGFIATLKIALFACDHSLPIPELLSPSGHMGMSTAVYSGFAMVFGTGLTRHARDIVIAGAIALITAIGASRLLLHYHSLVEIGVGLLVGAGALAMIMLVMARSRLEGLRIGYLAASAVVVACFFYGERWPAEATMHNVAQWLDALHAWCS
jgi:membrane-associated phospholipid phosphatase